MSYHDGSQVFGFHDLIRQFHDDLGGLGIQSGGMLIQNQEFDGGHGGHEKGHGLPLSSGENSDFHMEFVFQTKT